MSRIAVTAAVVVGILVFNHLFCNKDEKLRQETRSGKDPITAKLERLEIQAIKSRQKMQEARELAKSARKRGDKEAEEWHYRDALKHQMTTRCVIKEKANVIFDYKNKGQPEGIVDLRGIDVENAVDFAKRELQSATQRPNNVVHFIVGKGLHVKDAKEKIRPAVEELCKRRQLSFSLDAANSGILTVQC